MLPSTVLTRPAQRAASARRRAAYLVAVGLFRAARVDRSVSVTHRQSSNSSGPLGASPRSAPDRRPQRGARRASSSGRARYPARGPRARPPPTTCGSEKDRHLQRTKPSAQGNVARRQSNCVKGPEAERPPFKVLQAVEQPLLKPTYGYSRSRFFVPPKRRCATTPTSTPTRATAAHAENSAATTTKTTPTATAFQTTAFERAIPQSNT